MATTGATGSTRVDASRTSRARARIAERNHETKASFKTTEFWAMVALVVSILGAGYFISRGLAKSGSYEPDSDYNPVDLSERSRNSRDDR